MKLAKLLDLLKQAPLVASVQASPGSPVDSPETLTKLAQASLQEGVKVLRLEGVKNIKAIRSATGAPCIGLIKQEYPDSEVYITTTLAEVESLIALGCEVIALDATQRVRPYGASLKPLISRIHEARKLAMADCDCPASVDYAISCGADLIGTTLSGYTAESSNADSPDFDLLRYAVGTGKPTLAEGRYAEPWQVQSARAIGAAGVVIGGALNDPIKQTRLFLSAATRDSGPVGAVDIGGTWLRYGLIGDDGSILRQERIALPQSAEERLDWIKAMCNVDQVEQLGVSTGGTVDPATCTVIESKEIIPNNVGCDFRTLIGGRLRHVAALNDGLATALGHGHHPRFAGQRVATLALGTGVGFGLVDQGRLLMGSAGEYPRLNDVQASADETFEDLLGGASLTPQPTESQRADAIRAARSAIKLVQTLYYPDVIVVCGGVGLSDWMKLFLEAEYPQLVLASPFGSDAGLMGAAALARSQPV